jgi:DNA segregation ATPase FtsK/SpoIIIE, S-DNA-T family
MASLSSGFDRRGAPFNAREFLRRRLNEVIGTALFVASLIFYLILATYDHTDPSWDMAVDKVPANFGGPNGAVLADVLIQSVGAASVVLPSVCCVWALRMLLNLPIRRIGLRLLALPVLVLSGAISLGVMPGMAGGVIGRQFWQVSALGETASVPAMASAAIFGVVLVFVLGLSLLEWREVGGGAGKAAALSGRAGIWALHHGRRAASGLFTSLRAVRRQSRKQRGPLDPALRTEPVIGSEARFGADASPELPRFLTAAAAKLRRELPPDIVAPKSRAPLQGRRAETPQQASLDLEPEAGCRLPPLDLLAEPPKDRLIGGPSEEALQQNALLLLGVLEDFGVRGEIVKVRPGPVVTLYELEPAPGTKSSRVIGLADDIARSMSAVSVRVAVVPGRNVIGIELPNARSETVYLRELLASDAYERSNARLSLVLGKDIGGGPIITDLAKMPHLLIAGTTGSGKSVGINTMILSILYRMRPDECKFIMVDPKMLELSIYDGIPHLLAPVVTDPKKAVVALKWTVREMENRYRAMSKLGVRNIEGYNQRLAEAEARGETLSRRVQTGFDAETGEPLFEDQPLDSTKLPLIIVVVDEMADLMLVAGKDIEAAIQRLAQMARAAGIHIIMATQRPSVDVITGTIKANFPTRISFQVTSKIDSRTILGESGAEQLLGRGDMLHMAGGGRITRVHGPFVADTEVEAVVNFLKNQAAPDYISDITEDDLADAEEVEEIGAEIESGGEDLYDRAVALITRERKASTSFVQRHLQIGYNRAARIMDRMERENVVSAANHVGKREVLAPPPRL